MMPSRMNLSGVGRCGSSLVFSSRTTVWSFRATLWPAAPQSAHFRSLNSCGRLQPFTVRKDRSSSVTGLRQGLGRQASWNWEWEPKGWGWRTPLKQRAAARKEQTTARTRDPTRGFDDEFPAGTHRTANKAAGRPIHSPTRSRAKIICLWHYRRARSKLVFAWLPACRRRQWQSSFINHRG